MEEVSGAGKFLNFDLDGRQMGAQRWRNSLSLKLVQFIIQSVYLYGKVKKYKK